MKKEQHAKMQESRVNTVPEKIYRPKGSTVIVMPYGRPYRILLGFRSRRAFMRWATNNGTEPVREFLPVGDYESVRYLGKFSTVMQLGNKLNENEHVYLERAPVAQGERPMRIVVNEIYIQ